MKQIEARPERPEERILILAPVGRDAVLTADILSRIGLRCVICRSGQELVEEADRGAGVLLLTEEALTRPVQGRLLNILQAQPVWSDLPVVLLAASNPVGSEQAGIQPRLGVEVNVTMLRRPVAISSLVTVTQSALRARRRQYQMRALLAQLERQNRRLEQEVVERKQAQEALQHLNEMLEAQVAERTAKLRALSTRLAEVQESERQRLARGLHDEVGQVLTAVGLNLGFIQSQIPDEGPLAAAIQPRLAVSVSLIEQTVDHIREVMADLGSPLLDENGLGDALSSYAASFADWTGLSVTVAAESLLSRPARTVENALFRIAQEALDNVSKHAQASQVTIAMEADEEMVRLVIADDGIGFSAEMLPGAMKGRGWGLLTMSGRAEMVAGLCRIESRPGEGTRVIVEAPRAGRVQNDEPAPVMI